jgi:predicted secreted protein
MTNIEDEILAALKALHNGCRKDGHTHAHDRWKGNMCQLIQKAEAELARRDPDGDVL